MKSLWILGIAILLLACKNTTTEQDKPVVDAQEEVANQEEYSYGNQPMDPRGQNYICQAGRPGLSVELLQIAWNETDTGVVGMWYFNSKMDEPVRQVIHNQVYDLDNEVLTGTYSYPGAKEVMEFKLTKKKLISTYDGSSDEYILED